MLDWTANRQDLTHHIAMGAATQSHLRMHKDLNVGNPSAWAMLDEGEWWTLTEDSAEVVLARALYPNP